MFGMAIDSTSCVGAAAISEGAAFTHSAGFDSDAYLREVLERFADHPANRIDELLSRSSAAQHSCSREA